MKTCGPASVCTVMFVLAAVLTACTPGQATASATQIAQAISSPPLTRPTPSSAPMPSPSPQPEPAVSALTVADLEAGEWGNITFRESPAGHYEAEGIPGVKFYSDGVAEISYMNEDLSVAFQAVTQEEGNIVAGLWEYQNGEWLMDKYSAPISVEETKLWRSLIVVQGHEKEQAMIDSIFTARDLAMAKSEAYDPADEFKNISVTVNFRTIENVDVRPKEWRYYNISRGYPNAFLFRAISYSNEISFDDVTSTSNARPIQVSLGPGWFNVSVLNANNGFLEPTIHLPIIAMNTNRSIANLSTLIQTSRYSRVEHLVNRDSRGLFFFWIVDGNANADDRPERLYDVDVGNFIRDVNKEYFEVVNKPVLDNPVKLSSLPKELSYAFLKPLVQIQHYK